MAVARNAPVVVKAVVILDDEHTEAFVEVYTRDGSGKRLVTSVEVLSPSNKSPASPGYGLYRKKQREMLASKVHLVEIGLLRAGEHTTAVPHDLAVARAGPYDFHVCIHRFDEAANYYVYPIRLPERLPEILVPLLPGDSSVPLDLQSVLDRAYNTGHYRREIDYRKDPIVPLLAPVQATWAADIVARNAP